MTVTLSLETMHRRWPNGDQHIPGLIEGIVASAPAVFEKYGIADKPMAVAHFMAQASEECGQGLEMIESLNYTAARLRIIFPKHFTPSMAQRWAHNEKMIGEIAYGGRMGNVPPPSTDGYDYRGQGLTQVTGRDGATALQKMLDQHNAGFNVVDNPELIIDPAHTLECGIADWIVCGCLPFAMADDLVNETKRLNGGVNGLDERRRQLRLWKPEFGL
jgi:putative chitinase